MVCFICGFYYTIPGTSPYGEPLKQYLPQVDLQSHTTILSSTSRTTLTQTFVNPSESRGIKELRFTFPLYDGVSVVGFRCHVGERLIIGEVKEKEKAKAVYQEAIARGETAGLLEQLPDASDVFTTTIGHVPPGATLVTEITYLGELKHDAEADGIRFTIPTVIAPRYGSYPGQLISRTPNLKGKGIQITVDVEMPQNSFIQQIRSPSHPIAVTIGNTSLAPSTEPKMSSGSATLSLGSAELDTDFVLQIVAKDTGVPTAILETHPTIPNQRALMATLVPKFSLPPEKPEIVFVCDRSGSMSGSKIPLVISALKVFLKSLPLGVKFNICSFGGWHSFLWSKSKAYSQATLDEATRHVSTFSANFGGTEMLAPFKETMKRRFQDIPLEVCLLTDGEIWDQQSLFGFLNKEVIESKAPIRVFTLGIGNGVSHALIEGVAKAGNGFSQAVGEGEKLDSKVVRMLKGALSPHISDYSLEVKYVEDSLNTDHDDFEVIEKVSDSLRVAAISEKETAEKAPKKPISLFDTSVDLDKEEPAPLDDGSGQSRYSHLPVVAVPALLQTPQNIPPLFPFNRTSVYLLMGPGSVQKQPKSVILRGTSAHGPLELEIPVQVLGTPGETIHQLATKKAISELEQGRGWLTEAKDQAKKSLKSKYESRFEDMVEREAVRLGVQFQVGGKWCSFVAVESNKDTKFSDDSTLVNMEWLDVPSSTRQPIESSSENPVRHYLRSARGMDQINARMASGTSMMSSAPPQSRAPPPPPSMSRRSLLGSSSKGASPRPPAAAAPCAPIAYESLGSARSASNFGAPQSTAASNVPPMARSQYIDYEDSWEAEGTTSAIEKNLESVLQRGERLDCLMDKTESLSYTSKSFHSEAKAKKKKTGMFGMFGGAPKPSNPSAPAPFAKSAASSGSRTLLFSPSVNKLEMLVDLQTFEGYWEWNEGLSAVLGVNKEQAGTLVNANGWSQAVVATALAVAFFEKKMANEKDAWELVVEKAKGWLEGQVSGGADGVIGKAGVLIV